MRVFDFVDETAFQEHIEELPSSSPIASPTNSIQNSPFTSICKHCNWTDYPAVSATDLVGIWGSEFRKEHARSEWHRLNVALRTGQDPSLKALTFAEYEILASEYLPPPESISPVDWLLEIVREAADSTESCQTPNPQNSPFILLKQHQASTGGQPPIIYKCWKSAFTNRHLSNWLLMLNGGGYFAAALYASSKTHEFPSEPTLHKAIHKYTVRKGQGTSQSALDARKKCHSIGSALRRRNEIALNDEIVVLLQSWKRQMVGNDSVVVFCNKTPLNKSLVRQVFGDDVLIESIPFTTYRATTSEIARCFESLTRASVLS